MGKHIRISPEEAADRLAIRELVEAYAHALTAATRRVKWLSLPKTLTSWCT